MPVGNGTRDSGIGSLDLDSGTTSQAPRAKFQAHTSLNEQETTMPRSPRSRRQTTYEFKWLARLSAITITDKKHQGNNKNKR